jgi:hypothetical protein
LTLNKYMALGPSGARCQVCECRLAAGSKLLLLFREDSSGRRGPRQFSSWCVNLENVIIVCLSYIEQSWKYNTELYVLWRVKLSNNSSYQIRNPLFTVELPRYTRKRIKWASWCNFIASIFCLKILKKSCKVSLLNIVTDFGGFKLTLVVTGRAKMLRPTEGRRPLYNIFTAAFSKCWRHNYSPDFNCNIYHICGSYDHQKKKRLPLTVLSFWSLSWRFNMYFDTQELNL